MLGRRATLLGVFCSPKFVSSQPGACERNSHDWYSPRIFALASEQSPNLKWKFAGCAE